MQNKEDDIKPLFYYTFENKIIYVCSKKLELIELPSYRHGQVDKKIVCPKCSLKMTMFLI